MIFQAPELINLKQKGLVGHHIEDFIGTLKDNIQHEVRVLEPDSLEKAFRLARKVECKIMVTRNKEGSFATPRFPPPTRLTPQQLE